MGRIANKYNELKQAGKKGLVIYIMGGDPNLEVTEEIIPFLAELGVDFLEIGIPFSDPLADGPTIQEAGQRALKTSLTQLLEMTSKLRSQVEIPMLMMTYFNPILHLGLARFAAEAEKAGLDGVIIPDIIPEEAGELLEELGKHNIDYVPLLAPTSTDERIKKLAESATGFLYYVSRTGITGARSDVASDLHSNLKRIRSFSEMPIGVGFGISNPDQAAEIAADADAVIIGSAVVKIMEQQGSDLAGLKKALADFLSPIIDRLHQTA